MSDDQPIVNARPMTRADAVKSARWFHRLGMHARALGEPVATQHFASRDYWMDKARRLPILWTLNALLAERRQPRMISRE